MAFQSIYVAPCAERAQDGVLWKALAWAERLEAVLLLAALSPVLLVTGAIIMMLSRRSPLVAHQRVGLHGRLFWTLKFRSMWSRENVGRTPWSARVPLDPLSQSRAASHQAGQGAGRGPGGPPHYFVEQVIEEPAPSIKRATDPRVTSAFACFCRRFSIDELPQLVNVVRGEMSLVGPRPLAREEMRAHYASYAPEVLSVKPGITGLWQVMGRSRLTYPQRLRLDLFLVRKRSARLYGAILLRTLPEVLAGRNSW
jgi:lipopolysaccharide/colanic/teichoic acid biosynthesis glycosyltransferase